MEHLAAFFRSQLVEKSGHAAASFYSRTTNQVQAAPVVIMLSIIQDPARSSDHSPHLSTVAGVQQDHVAILAKFQEEHMSLSIKSNQQTIVQELISDLQALGLS